MIPQKSYYRMKRVPSPRCSRVQDLLMLSICVAWYLEVNSRDRTQPVVGQSHRSWLASSRWAAAAQFALAASLTASQKDLQRSDIEDKNNIPMKTKDAVITLQGVLEGKHDKEIDNTLNQHHIPRQGWWSAFFRIVVGMAVMGRLAHNRLRPLENDFEDKATDWS